MDRWIRFSRSKTVNFKAESCLKFKRGSEVGSERRDLRDNAFSKENKIKSVNGLKINIIVLSTSFAIVL